MPYPLAGTARGTTESEFFEPSINLLPVTPNSTIHTPGAWAQLEPSTAFDWHGFEIRTQGNLDNAASQRFWMLDLAIGSAGNEIPIIESLLWSGVAYRNPHFAAFIPLRVPRGSRVSIRAQTDYTPNDGFGVYIIGHSGPSMFPCFQRCTTIGANRATTRGVPVPSGFSPPTPFEISASLPTSAKAMLVSGSTLNDQNTRTYTFLTGAAAAETVVSQGVTILGGILGANGASPLVPVSLSAGQRLSAFAQHGSGANGTTMSTIVHLFD